MNVVDDEDHGGGDVDVVACQRRNGSDVVAGVPGDRQGGNGDLLRLYPEAGNASVVGWHRQMGTVVGWLEGDVVISKEGGGCTEASAEPGGPVG